MKSLQVRYDEDSQTIDAVADAAPEPWQDVCDRYDNDVHRIRDVDDRQAYTAVYVCYDENNRPVYYLVEEDKALARLRHKTFLKKLGRE